MFGSKPIRLAKDFKPGTVVRIVSNGKVVTIIAKGDGTNVGVSNGKDSWVMSGEIRVQEV